jgi:hypothetical protein
VGKEIVPINRVLQETFEALQRHDGIQRRILPRSNMVVKGLHALSPDFPDDFYTSCIMQSRLAA